MTPDHTEPLTRAPDGRPVADQPDWRQDFPIDVELDKAVARRDFTSFMVLTSMAFALGQLWILVQNYLRGGQAPPTEKAIALVEGTSDQFPALPVGGTLFFTYPTDNEPCILLRPEPQTFVAYNQKCTHLSCAVVPHLDEGRIHCPCHHGVFDLPTGRPIAGPPRRPLTRIQLEIRAGVIYAVGVELRTV